MRSMRASCGHWLAEDEGDDGLGTMATIKRWSRENTRSTDYMSLCDNCYDEYNYKGYILHNLEEERQWFDGEID